MELFFLLDRNSSGFRKNAIIMFYFKTNTTVLLTKVEVQEKAMTDSFLDTTFEAETSDHPVNLEKHLT